MRFSNCCGAELNDKEICTACLEHAAPMEKTYDELMDEFIEEHIPESKKRLATVQLQVIVFSAQHSRTQELRKMLFPEVTDAA